MTEEQILSNVLKGFTRKEQRVIYAFITDLALNGVISQPFGLQLMLTSEMSNTDKTFINKTLKEMSAL